MGIYSFHDAGEHEQELDIFIRCLTRIQKVHAVIRRNGPVVMFAGTVHTGIRFFMQKASHAMFRCDFFHRLHNDLVMVYRDVGRLINRRQLMLCRSHFIMLRFRRNTQLPEFFIQVFHICADTFSDNAKVMIFHFLSLRGRRSKQGTSGKHQVGSFHIQFFVYQEIFLLRPY